MATTFIRVPQTGGAPEDYLVSGAADIDMLSCSAHFNGGAAGVDFKPAIQVLDEAGNVAATVVGPTVTAGGSADVTFAPFLENEEAGSTGGGIQFDVSPQPGDFFDLRTEGPSFLGLTIEDDGPGGLYIRSTNNGFLLIDASQQLYIHGSRVSIHSDNDTEVFLGSTGDRFAIFNHLNQVIFEIDEDGQVYGLASVGAIQWTL